MSKLHPSPPRQFGQLFEVIVGGVSGIIMGHAAAADALSAYNYVRNIKKIQDVASKASIEYEQQKEALDEQKAFNEARLQEVTNRNIKRLAVFGIFMLFFAVVIGLAAFYYVSVGDENA